MPKGCWRVLATNHRRLWGAARGRKATSSTPESGAATSRFWGVRVLLMTPHGKRSATLITIDNRQGEKRPKVVERFLVVSANHHGAWRLDLRKREAFFVDSFGRAVDLCRSCFGCCFSLFNWAPASRDFCPYAPSYQALCCLVAVVSCQLGGPFLFASVTHYPPRAGRLGNFWWKLSRSHRNKLYVEKLISLTDSRHGDVLVVAHHYWRWSFLCVPFRDVGKSKQYPIMQRLFHEKLCFMCNIISKSMFKTICWWK